MPTARLTQGEPHRYRLRYTKLGRAAYLGHLDLVRHLPRIFRRAGLELYYSQGFHPKPELSFGPALGLGIPSLAELLDVTLVDDVDPAALVARLAAVTLPGIEILAAGRLGDNDRALGRVISRADFVARLPSAADAARAAARFASAAPLTVRRESERGAGGIARALDVRRTLVSVEAFEDAGLRRRFDWPAAASEGDGVGEGRALLRFSLAVDAEGSARPAEVVASLCGEEAADAADLARAALWGSERSEPGTPAVDPLDAVAMRRRPTTAGAGSESGSGAASGALA